MEHRELSDDRLLELLAEVFDETDPVPPDALETARAAELNSLDEQLAELIFDSLADEQPATTRSAVDRDDEVRTLSFTAGDLTIEVDLADGDLVGRVQPPPDEPFEVLQTTGRHSVTPDEQGWFRSPVDPGPLRLRFSHAGTVTTTPWITC